MKLGIVGYRGKMGQAILEEITTQEGIVLSILHSRNTNNTTYNDIDVTTSLLEVVNNCDVIIDFSRPTTTIDIVHLCVKYDKPIVSGTTGFSSDEMDKIRTYSKYGRIFYSPNMSIGIAILTQIVQKSIHSLAAHGVLRDISILETHHRHKFDKPSGTAIMLASKINQTSRDIQPEITSLRYGTAIGEHEVILSTDMEILTLKHNAVNRKVFAIGAINAAKFLFKQSKNGLYTMDDMLQESM